MAQHPRPRPTAADRAAEILRDRILAGELSAGSALPGERELSEQMGISRLTLRTALTRLEAEGLIHASQGAATRVLDFRASGGLGLVAPLARLELGAGRAPLSLLEDLLELRRMVAVEVLGIVAGRATDAEIEALRVEVERLALYVQDPDEFMRRDLAFARSVVRAAHNVALELLFNTIARMAMEEPLLRPVFQINITGTLAVYRTLVSVVERRDAERVRRASRRLLERMDQRMLKRVRRLGEGARERGGAETRRSAC